MDHKNFLLFFTDSLDGSNMEKLKNMKPIKRLNKLNDVNLMSRF